MKELSTDEMLTMLHEQFAQGSGFSIVVRGTSMVPFLRSGKDSVVLVPLREEPRVGQILLFRDGQRLILHRLIRKENDRYVMNGDGQEKLEVIRREQVEAVVSQVVRRSGRRISCDSPGFRLVSSLWRVTRPFRHWLIPLAENIKRRIYRR